MNNACGKAAAACFGIALLAGCAGWPKVQILGGTFYLLPVPPETEGGIGPVSGGGTSAASVPATPNQRGLSENAGD